MSAYRPSWAKRVVLATGLLTVGLLWWFPGYDYIVGSGHPNYRLPIFYLAIITISMVFNIIALKRFNGILKTVVLAEEKGMLERGSTIYAYNQRFRYVIRTIEDFWVLSIPIILIYSVKHPDILMNPYYSKSVITYFFSVPALTGYLTKRDLDVVKEVRTLHHNEGLYLDGRKDEGQ